MAEGDIVAVVSDALPWGVSLGDNLIDLQGRGLLAAYEVHGPSPDEADAAELQHRADLYGRALGQLQTGDVVHVLMDRLPVELPPNGNSPYRAANLVAEERRADQYWQTPSRLYLSCQYPSAAHQAVQSWLLGDKRRRSRQDMIREQTLARWQNFRDATKGAFTLRPMTRVEMFRDLFFRVTYHTYPIELPDDGVDLSAVIGAAEHQTNGKEPHIAGWNLRPLVVTEYPNRTLPQMLAPLLEHNGHLTLSLRYEALTAPDAQENMKETDKHWRQAMAGSFGQLLNAMVYGQKVDHDAVKQQAELEHTVAASKGGMPFGHVGVVVLVRDREPTQADIHCHNLLGTLHGRGIMARLEDNGAARAIEQTWPGQFTPPSRLADRHRLPLTSYNFAELSLPATLWQGLSHIDSEMFPKHTSTPLVTSGVGSIPFYWPTHINGVGHQIWFGSTGSGKSTMLAALGAALLNLPNSRIAIQDWGYSSFIFGHLLGARYYNVGASDSLALCPLAMLDQPNGLHRLLDFFQRLFARWDLKLRERQWDDFRGALVKAKLSTNYLGEPLRQLVDFRGLIEGGDPDRERIREILQQYCLAPELGGWGHVFNGKPSQHEQQRVTIYEMHELGNNPQLAGPACELILQHMVAGHDSRNPLFIFNDEFHRTLADRVLAAAMERTIREYRRLNIAFIGCTQSTVEIANSPIRDLLLENMPVKVFLSNRAANDPYTRGELHKLGVTDDEAHIIASLEPKGGFLCKTPYGNRRGYLHLGPVSQVICGSTARQSVETARELLTTHDNDFLEQWIRASGLHLPDPPKAFDVQRSRMVPNQYSRNGHDRLPRHTQV